VAGVFGAVFGAIGGIFGAIFGHWHFPFHFSTFWVVVGVICLALLVRSRRET
jgi:hypothetical protein